MIRRLALILALLSPVAGLAQAAGEVVVLPPALGVADCEEASKFITISWMTTVTPVAGDVYRVYVNTTGCSASAMTTGQIGSDITPSASSGTAPEIFPSPPTRMDFLVNQAGIADCKVAGPTIKIYVCVQQVSTAVGTPLRTSMNGQAQLYRSPPPVPVNLQVAPGDSALYVSWDVNPEGTGVAASSYDVTAVADTPPNAADTHTQSFTGTSNNRVSGLTNGVKYKVTVNSVSPGSNPSIQSVEAFGTPAPVSDFWDTYKTEDHGREVGGCGGGSAGLVSLLGVALALRGLRRKS